MRNTQYGDIRKLRILRFLL